MLQRLPIALAEVETGNKYENWLNDIRQIIYSLYRAKEITKKSIQQYHEFNKVIIQKLILCIWILKIVNYLILTDKIGLRRKGKYIAENLPYLEIIEVALIYCNVFSNSYQQKPRVYICF